MFGQAEPWGKAKKGSAKAMQIVKYRFESHSDERGKLVALEEFRNVPFKIRRVYYMFDTGRGVRRGYHAHRCLEQILVCVHGSCKVLLDNGAEHEIVELNDPCEGLYIANDTWREMFDFSSDAVLMVLASELYDEDDYVRDYNDFLKMVQEKQENGGK